MSECRILVTLQESYPTTNVFPVILDAPPVKGGRLDSLYRIQGT